jgi:hypothetical protein
MAWVAFISLIFALGIFYNAWDAYLRGSTKSALLSGLLGVALLIGSGLSLYFNPISPWAPITAASYGFGPGWQCFGKPAAPMCIKTGLSPKQKGN